MGVMGAIRPRVHSFRTVRRPSSWNSSSSSNVDKIQGRTDQIASRYHEQHEPKEDSPPPRYQPRQRHDFCLRVVNSLMIVVYRSCAVSTCALIVRRESVEDQIPST